MVMDVYGESQPRRPSIKRPWEEDTTLPESGNAWHSALLPPIDAVPYGRGSTQIGGDDEVNWTDRFRPGSKGSAAKRAKFESHEYNTIPRQHLELNGKIPAPQTPNLMYTQTQRSLETLKPNGLPNGQNGPPNPSGPPNGRGGSAGSQDMSQLCRRCKRLAIQERGPTTVGVPDNCDDCKRNPELAWVTQECSAWLTHLADTLRSGVSSEQRGIIRGLDQHRPGSTTYPPIEQFGLKQTLNWVLGRIHHVNQLADQLIGQVPAASLPNLTEDIYGNGTKVQDGPADSMKRRNDVDSEDLNSRFMLREDANSSSKQHTKQKLATTSMPGNDELPPLRSQSEYHPSLPTIDGQRGSVMNPPPAPNRQLPSSPGRSLPSPTSISFPSPSTSSYGKNNSQGVSLPPPSVLHQSASNNYLPPINSAHTSDTALREHTAALQHEVSVQKIALSSLQGEHDKLLAAFSRSQTRASVFEKKHAVSDTEIINLTEEKLRLQAQVIELEREVEELARSRDEFRQAAVQEGAQYVEIVKKASRLEEMAGEERKNWNKLKGEMEREIEALNAGRSGQKEGLNSSEESVPVSRGDDMETVPHTSSEESVPRLKMELTSEPGEPQSHAPMSHPSSQSVPQEPVEELKEEIQRLRKRCAEVENAMRVMRDDSRSMEDIVKMLVERADSTLQG